MIRSLGAKFITSSPSIKEAPSFVTSEVVFLGRSNVGKSSLINTLVNQKNLAKSSSNEPFLIFTLPINSLVCLFSSAKKSFDVISTCSAFKNVKPNITAKIADFLLPMPLTLLPAFVF